jgi:O-antigen ligase
MTATSETTLHQKLQRYVPLVVEYLMYVYALTFLFDKGTGIKNICIYTALAGSLYLAFTRRPLFSSRAIIYIYAAMLASYVLSASLSFMPAYSLDALGKDVMKGAFLFFIAAVSFTHVQIRRMALAFAVSGVVILALGLHGFLTTGGMSTYTADSYLMPHKDKNTYGFFMGFLMPFFVMTAATMRTRAWQAAFGLVALWGVAASVLSASRSSFLNIAVVLVIWGLSFFRTKHFRTIIIAAVVLALAVPITYSFWPERTKRKISKTRSELMHVNHRVDQFWIPAVESVKKRPLVGWGYGKKIYRDPRPFEGTQKPNWEKKGGLHSTFVGMLFHQGLLGFSAMLIIIGWSIFTLIMLVRRSTGPPRYAALMLLSLICGTFVVSAFFKYVQFRLFSLALGMTVALLKANGDTPEAGTIDNQ